MNYTPVSNRLRIDWLDTAKGMGIVLVVIGHATDTTISRWVYLFHMPLFFMIAGILFRPMPLGELIMRRGRTLLIPYFSFLICLETIFCLSHLHDQQWSGFTASVDRAVYGGSRLDGDFGTFWFLTCLFFALLSYNLLRKVGEGPLAMPVVAAVMAVTGGAYLIEHTNWPEDISVVPMAIFFLWAGEVWATLQLSSRSEAATGPAVRRVLFWPSVGLAVLGAILLRPLDMKQADYGIPVLSLLIALAYCHLTLLLCRKIGSLGKLGRFWSALGAASLCIMLLHRMIILHLAGRLSWRIVTVVATAIPWGVYRLLQHAGPVFRFLFLGVRAEVPSAVYAHGGVATGGSKTRL